MAMLESAEEPAFESGPYGRRKTDRPCATAEDMLRTIGDIYHITDLDTLLERILTETRRFVNADAGTVYLAAKGQLFFNVVQNDTLFRDPHAKEKYVYSRARLPIDRTSLAGYVAVTGQSLLIDDVYHIKSGVSYSFNPAFDRKTSYKTTSILMVPIITRNNVLMGVLQLINAKGTDGRVVPFSMQDTLYIVQFANYAAHAIESAKLSREMALRMVEIAALRDPSETAAHAKRVSALAVELYTAWAKKHGAGLRELRQTRDVLRIAAILHDVGKVAISDVILKKRGKLDERETYHVRCHTVYGARLFVNANSPWDRAASEVALNHHERWDGGGYPGRMAHVFSREITFGPGKKGEEIPLLARVVSIADVFDSLVSKRVYKHEWPEAEAFRYVRNHSGSLFDPELVSLFLAMSDTAHAIEERYKLATGAKRAGDKAAADKSG
ncbi:MAG: HD domain-containing protein [Spirochaetales bacterium]|nr:HD domain-containing protein [Spirochaetales bacterium]